MVSSSQGSFFSGRASHALVTIRARVDLRLEHPNVRQVAVALRKIESVADDELVRDGKPGERQRLSIWPQWERLALIEQGADAQAGWAAHSERLNELRQR